MNIFFLILCPAIEKSLSYKLEEARNAIQLRIVKALREYRNLYSVQHRVGNRMIYPESLKFLPLYGLALCKSIPLRGGYADAQLDERCAAGYTMMALPVKKLLKLLYPNLVRVDEWLLKVSYFLCLDFHSDAIDFGLHLISHMYCIQHRLMSQKTYAKGYHLLRKA